MYQVQLTKTAAKQLKKLDKRYINACVKAIDRLANDPKIGIPLVGKLKGYWKLKFSRYRIIYQFENDRLLVFVFDIKHRKDVYRMR